MRRVLAAAVLLALSSGAQPSAAQDDWSLTREPERPSRPARPRPRPAQPDQAPAREAAGPDLLERYVRALLAHPADAFALGRLRELAMARDGSLDKVVERFAVESGQHPGDASVREAFARVLTAAGQGARAVAELEGALAASAGRERERLGLLRAELLRGQGRPDEARTAFEALSAPANAIDTRKQALAALGGLELASGRLDAAQERYRQLTQVAGGSGVEWPRALSAAGRHAEATRAYAELAEAQRGDARAARPYLREAARAAIQAGDASQAIALLERALVQAPEGERTELYDLAIEAHRQASRLSELADRLGEEGRGRPALLLRAAMLWDELGREAQALEAYRAVLAKNPRDVDTRARLARLLARSGRLDELVREYTTLVSLAPDEPSFVLALAELLRERGERGPALEVLARASQRAPRSLALHRALLDVYTRWGARAEAERELLLLARLDPDDPSHTVALGEDAFERGDKAGALRIWQRLLEHGGDRAQAHVTLASVLGDHGLYEQAVEQIAQAVELAPDRVDVRRTQASLLERAGKPAEAEVAHRWVLEHAGGDAAVRREARQHLVNIWLRGGLAGRRAQELEARFRGAPPDLEAGRTLAELYAHEPARAEAELSLLVRIAELAPDDVETLRALERAYTRRGALDRAQATLDRLVSADPASASAYLGRAVDLALSRYRDDEALAYARRAVQIRPDDGKAQRLLGDLFRRRQELDAAVTAYERAAQLDPRDHDTRLLLAQIETARGRDEAAERWLREVVENSPDDELVGRAARAAMELSLPEGRRERLELRLLELCLARPERPLYRRLLVESYARRLGPLAERVLRGTASAEERALVERVGSSSIKPLLEALADSDPTQRDTALDLLGAARVKHAGGPLMTLAEQGDNALERARALAAVGFIGDPTLGPRLRKLLSRSERRLAPMALWALARSEGARAADLLLARLRDGRDASVRVMCTLALGALGVREATPLFVELARDRHVALRAAALWSLAQLDAAAHRPLFVEALTAAPPASLVALASLPDDFDVLARALSSSQPEPRALAVQLLVRGRARTAVLPPPSLPFTVRSYMAALLTSDAPALPSALLDRRIAELGAAYERSLGAEVPERELSLSALSPFAGGLVPRALLEQGVCPSRAQALTLAAALRDVLGSLASEPRFPGREQALWLLAASGGGDQPSVLAALRGEDVAVRLRVLDALALTDALPQATRRLLAQLFDQATDWPTRLRIARLLHDGLGRERLAREPVALVRAAAAEGATQAAPLCSERPVD